MGGSIKDIFAEEILAVLVATKESLAPDGIVSRMTRDHGRRLGPREVFLHLHGCLAADVVAEANGSFRLRNQVTGAPGGRDAAERGAIRTGEAVHAEQLETPLNSKGGIACLPVRGQFSGGPLSRFSLSLRGKHQHGVLDRVSTRAFGAPFFSLGLHGGR
jgi:hypothetical protein